jgi:hypothetical protein
MERSESTGMGSGMGSDQSNFGSAPGEQTSFQSSSAGQSSDIGGDSGGGFSGAQAESGIKGRVKTVASSVKDKASGLPSIIADGLEAGANALRQNRTSTTQSGESGSMALTNDNSIAAVTDTLASGMQSSADWIRDADVDKLKAGVEKQVKEHPARSLLVALGAGYLIGKALRR